jgi:hypothetical protein
MTNKKTRLSVFISSCLASSAALATPKPFDRDLAIAVDEEVVMHSIVACGPGERICEEEPLDLDGDGAIDLVVGINQDGDGSPKRFFTGRGTTGLGNGLFNSGQYVGRSTTTSGIKFADLDGDGDLDMVESVRGNGTTGINAVYVNRNGSLKSLWEDEQALDSSRDRSSSVAIGDVNGDGKLDIIIGKESTGSHDGAPAKTNHLYLNTTTAANTNVSFTGAIALDAPGAEKYTRRVLLIDVDGDNDLDLVATSANTSADGAGNGNVLYVNTGGDPANPLDNPFAAAVPLNSNTSDDTDVANGIAAGDIDGDGDPDLVFSNWSNASGYAADRYYINKSTPGNIDFETTGTFGPDARSTNLRLADFNNDGLLDVVVLRYEGPNRLHLNTGNPAAPFDNAVASANFELYEPTGLQVNRSRGLDFGDINNDGSLDLIVVNRGQIGLRYLNNDGCVAGNCGLFAHPFDNDGPSVVSQSSSTTVPPGGQPIDINAHLAALEVEDTDNVYPADFLGMVPEPTSTMEYTCTNGVVPSGNGLISGTCVDGMITPIDKNGNGVIGPVIVRVTDGEDLSNRLNDFAITIGTGSAPTFTSTTLPNATEDAAYSTQIAASDADGDTITFEEAAPLPAWLQLSSTGLLSSVAPPTQGDVGVNHTVSVRIKDQGGLASTRDFTVAVDNVNDAPTILSATLPGGTQGQAYNATVEGSDDDPGTTLTYLSTGLPAGLTMSTAGVISGTPTVSGDFTIVLTANDGTVSSAPVNVPLSIAAAPGQPPANRAPVFTAPAAQSATVGTNFTLSLAGSATDADGDPLTFSATGLPPGITITTAGLLSGAPTTASGSPFTVAVTVSDGKGGDASGSFQITVANPTTNSGGGSGGGGDSGGGGGSLGLFELLGMAGFGAWAVRRRRPKSGSRS